MYAGVATDTGEFDARASHTWAARSFVSRCRSNSSPATGTGSPSRCFSFTRATSATSAVPRGSRPLVLTRRRQHPNADNLQADFEEIHRELVETWALFGASRPQGRRAAVEHWR